MRTKGLFVSWGCKRLEVVGSGQMWANLNYAQVGDEVATSCRTQSSNSLYALTSPAADL